MSPGPQTLDVEGSRSPRLAEGTLAKDLLGHQACHVHSIALLTRDIIWKQLLAANAMHLKAQGRSAKTTVATDWSRVKRGQKGRS